MRRWIVLVIAAGLLGGCAPTPVPQTSGTTAPAPDLSSAGVVDGKPVYVTVAPIQVVGDHAELTVEWSRPDTCRERSSISIGALLEPAGGVGAIELVAADRHWLPGVTAAGQIATDNTTLEALPSATVTSVISFAVPDATEVDVVIPGLCTIVGVPVTVGQDPALQLPDVVYPTPTDN